jgi:hypothetical protein
MLSIFLVGNPPFENVAHYFTDHNEHFDIYLARTIYPVLVPGLESLSMEIERIMTESKQTEL